MKYGFELFPGTSVSWRADAGDECVEAHMRMLSECLGIDELPDDGGASCRIIVRNRIPTPPNETIRYRRMKIRFVPECGVNDIMVADLDESPEELEHSRWGNVRRIVFQGMVPHMLRRECFIVHGALLEHDGKALLLCGPSGIGKSTTSRRLSRKLTILADDCVCLYRRDGEWLARPLPTWSSYLFGKARLAECEVRRETRVSQLLIIGRSNEKYTKLRPDETMLGIAMSFTEMVKWHTGKYPATLRTRLYDAAVDGASELSRTLPAGALQLTLECDIFRLLPDMLIKTLHIEGSK